MFDSQILSLSRQGMTTGGIALHLGLSAQYVRQVVSSEVTGLEVKPLYVETAPEPLPRPRSISTPQREGRRSVDSQANRRAAAEKKRAAILQKLSELNTALEA